MSWFQNIFFLASLSVHAAPHFRRAGVVISSLHTALVAVTGWCHAFPTYHKKFTHSCWPLYYYLVSAYCSIDILVGKLPPLILFPRYIRSNTCNSTWRLITYRYQQSWLTPAKSTIAHALDQLSKPSNNTLETKTSPSSQAVFVHSCNVYGLRSNILRFLTRWENLAVSYTG